MAGRGPSSTNCTNAPRTCTSISSHYAYAARGTRAYDVECTQPPQSHFVCFNLQAQQTSALRTATIQGVPDLFLNLTEAFAAQGSKLGMLEFYYLKIQFLRVLVICLE